MKNSFRNLASFLVVGSTLLTSIDLHATDNDQVQVQVLESRSSVPIQTLLAQEYDRLFLDDWQRLVMAGRNSEAVQLAIQTEKECCQAMNHESFMRNTALYYSLYRLSQHRTYLKPDERFSLFHFREFHSNPEKLIEIYQSNIKNLENELKCQEARLCNLREMEQKAPNQRGELRQKIEAYLKEVTTRRDEIIAACEDKDVIELVTEIGEQVHGVYKMFCAFQPDFYGDKEASRAAQDIESIRSKMFERMNGAGLRKKTEAIRQRYRTAQNMPEETRRILVGLRHNIEYFFSPPLYFASACKDWLETKPSTSLSNLDAAELTKRLEHLEALRQDTQDKIAKENARIAFIRSNPGFFQIPLRTRAELLGVRNSEEWWISSPSRPVGNGVVVGVIDTFDNRLQNCKILRKAVNQEFVGSGYIYEVNESIKENHGIGVASIIVSDDMDSNDKDNGITVGVAPGAQFEMIDHSSISIEDNIQKLFGADFSWGNEIEWTPQNMAEAISELARTGAISALGLTKNMVGDCPAFQSKARIFNFSMSHSGLKRFSRLHPTKFEGLFTMPVFLQLLKSKLLIQALGNDGVKVCSSDQYRLAKALALCPETSPNFLVVTNLMRDGITLNPTSNVPGDEAYLQDRTLSAPGSELTAAILTEGTKSYENYDNGGTSYATPHVSGVAAVVLSNFPTLTTMQLASCLLNSATPLLATQSGISYELLGVTSGELKEEFAKYPYADSIKINGQVIDRQDWLRGKAHFGQGRVHLENAMKLAATLVEEDLT